jgi:hypothetical protein
VDPAQNPFQNGGYVPGSGDQWTPPTQIAGLPQYQALMQQTSNAGLQSNQNWTGLISQLKQNAAGNGPAQALAKSQYAQGSQNAAGQLAGAAHGGGMSSFRNAVIQQGAVGQAGAAGLATATNQAQQAGQNSLAGALSARDTANAGYMGLQNNLSTQAGAQALTQEQINNGWAQALLGGASAAAGGAATAAGGSTPAAAPDEEEDLGFNGEGV